MAADKVWLRNNLAKALGWDPSVAEEVVEAISLAQSKKERDDLVQGHLGGGAKVKGLVEKFLRHSQQPALTGHAIDVRGREHRPGERQAGSVTVRHVAGRQGAGRMQASAQQGLPEREICNCISCGKIYFTRSDTADTIAFIESGGMCTFCGARVALTSGATSQSRSTAGSSRADADAAPSSSSGEQTAAAVAFKNRLVEYDRNARQRTTVVDDQNDFFEIDTNAWLDPEEREQLKRQEVEMREAEEARRKRVTVTLDLLGRQVLMADEAPPTQQALQDAQRSAEAARATAAVKPQGGGTAAKSAMQAASRIQPNTCLKTERPMFVPTTPETTEERQKRRGLAPAKPAIENKEQQAVVGGWGDEKASTSRGSGLSTSEARTRQSRAAEPNESNAGPVPRQAERQQTNTASSKKARRPQLKRLQHDDPFEGADMMALDDVRPDEVPAQ